MTIAALVKDLKYSTNGWLKRKDPKLAGFNWQRGYGVFAVSESNDVAVRQYVENQDVHHRKLTFKEEFEILLKRHGVNYDASGLWV